MLLVHACSLVSGYGLDPTDWEAGRGAVMGSYCLLLWPCCPRPARAGDTNCPSPPRESNARLSRQPMSTWCFPYLQPRDAPKSGGQNCRSSKLLSFRGTCIHLYAHSIFCSYEDFDCCSRAPCHHAIDILLVFCLFATIYHSNMSWYLNKMSYSVPLFHTLV